MLNSYKKTFTKEYLRQHITLYLLAPFRKCINLEILRHYLDELRALPEFESFPILRIDSSLNRLISMGGLYRSDDTPFPILKIAPLNHFFLKRENVDYPPVFYRRLDTAFIKVYSKLGKQLFELFNSKKEYELNMGRFYMRWEIDNFLYALNKIIKSGKSIEGVWLAIDRWYSLENKQKERLRLAQDILVKIESLNIRNISLDLKMDYGELLLRIGHTQSAMQQYDLSKESYLKLLQLHEEHDFGKEQERALGDIYHNLGIVSHDMKKMEEAEQYYQKALAIFDETKDMKSQAEVYANLGNLMADKKIFEASKRYYDQALQVFEQQNDKSATALIWYNLGLLEEELTNYSKARKYLLKALPIFMQFNDQLKVASIYRSLGVIADFNGELQESLQLYKQSISILIKLNDEGSIAGIYQNMGVIAKDLGNSLESYEYYGRALSIYRKLNYEIGQAQVLQNLGTLCFDERKMREAFSHFQEALSIYESLKDIYRQAGIFQNLGALFYIQLDFIISYDFYLKSLKIFLHYKNKDRIKELMENFQHLVTVSGDSKYLEKPIQMIKGVFFTDS